jgi:hypothetical protein
MKSRNVLAVGSIALSAFLFASPAMAQDTNSMPAPSGDRVDANGMPTTHSTPQEQAQTANLNDRIGVTNNQADSHANTNDAQYQAQQQQYQDQLQKNQRTQQDYQDLVQDHK